MQEETPTPLRHRSVTSSLADHQRDLVVGAALVMVLAQLGLVAWALFTNWFFYDDFSLLLDAQEAGLTLDYLLDPWNVHLIPGGRAIAWAVAETGPLNWTLAVALTLVLQLLSSLAALWMLATLFGRRWGILVPLALYLTTSMTMPALMWWTACLNQLAMQLGFFLAVGAAVRYFRGDGLRWALVAYAGVAFGVLFDVKAVLILPVVAYVAVAYFASGGPLSRLVGTIRRYWASILIGAPLALGYLVYYATHTGSQTDPPSLADGAEAVGNMIGTAFAAAAVGGPWRWTQKAGVAHPPDWAVHLSWVLIALVIGYGALRRRRTGRAWALLAGYLAILAGLLVTSRVTAFGAEIGLEYRYLTDAACVVALCVGLAFLRLEGADQSSEPRDPPLLTRPVPVTAVVVLTALVAVSGTVSTVRYVSWWRDQNIGESYLSTLASEMENYGTVDVADTAVPDDVMSGLLAPDNTVARLSRLLPGELSFPEWSPSLATIADDGTLQRTDITGGTSAEPGPDPDCGWSVDEDGATIPLSADLYDWTWWIKIGYLSSADSPVTIEAGDSVVNAEVMTGLNDLYVKITGSFDSVRIDGLDPDVVMCVDTVEVGDPAPGGELP